MGYNQYGPPEVIQRQRLTDPEQGPDELLVRVIATSINPLEWKLRSRQMRMMRPGFPQILGFDLSGEVLAVGDDVTDFAVGDEVYGLLDLRKDGANAPLVRTQAVLLTKKPPTLTHEQAAAIPLAGLTALRALRLDGRLQAGQRVLIIGASGGVGTFAVQIAKARGAHVTAVCSHNNAELVASLGADEVIAYDQQEIPDEARYDLIFDAVKARSYGTTRRYLNRGGGYVGTLPDEAGVWQSRLSYLTGKRHRCATVRVQPDPHGLRVLSALVASGELRPVIEKTLPLSELAEAHRISEAGRVVGKLVIRVADETAA